MLLIERPTPEEFAPYYGRYIEQVPRGDVLETLEAQHADTVELLDRFGEARGAHRYVPGKWSVKEVVGHIADAERIFTYRALCAARGETGALPPFDENAYVEAAGFDRRTLGDLLAELAAVRDATLRLLRGLPADASVRRGIASGGTLSVRALAYVVAGHELHHREVLKTRYGIG